MGQIRVNGKQRQKMLGRVRSKGGSDGLTRAMAERALRDFRASEEDAAEREEAMPTKAKTTLADVAEVHFHYLATVMGRKQRTVDDYRSMLRVHLVPFFGDVGVKDISKTDVERFMEHVITSGRSRGTMLNLVNLLHAILKEALLADLVDFNAVEKTRRPKAPGVNKKIRWLTPEDVQALIRAAPHDDFGRIEAPLYLVAAWTGLREGELFALRWQNVDFGAGLIRVRESWSGGLLSDPKSYGSVRSVPMIPTVAQTLAQLASRDLRVGDDDLVFAHPHKGTFLSPYTIVPRFKKALVRAGVREVRFHDLRHTFGTQMAAGGVPMRTLQAWMGHASVQTTEVYAQYASDPSGGRDLAQRAFEVVNSRNNCSITAAPSGAVDDVAA